MLKAGAGVCCGAMAAHFADAQRAHEGATIGRAAADDFGIRRASAESLQIAAHSKDRAQMSGEDLGRALGLLLPWPVYDLRGQDDGGSRSVGVGLGSVAILRSRQDGELILSQM